MIENIEQAKERFKEIVDFYKLNDENNYDYSDDVLISMKLVLEEIERLENIIKEVREYIQDRYDGEVLTHTFDKDNVGELLEILDKGSDEISK